MNLSNPQLNGGAREVSNKVDEANRRIDGINQRVAYIEGELHEQQKHQATTADVERAKTWFVTTIAASGVALLAAIGTIVIAFMRVWSTLG